MHFIFNTFHVGEGRGTINVNKIVEQSGKKKKENRRKDEEKENIMKRAHTRIK